MTESVFYVLWVVLATIATFVVIIEANTFYLILQDTQVTSDSKKFDLLKSDNVIVLINICKYKVLYSKFST